MRLAARVGFGAIDFHNHKVHSLRVNRIELDETWSFVGKKQRRVTPADGLEKGDQYVFIAMAGSQKAIISSVIGKRNEENTARSSETCASGSSTRRRFRRMAGELMKEQSKRRLGASANTGKS